MPMAGDEYPRAYVYRQVVRAKLFIDCHFAEDIDLAGIAGEAFYSRHYFLRLFKSMYGTTPLQYRKRVRIDRAKRLLAQGRPVTEVSLEVGFESPTSFSATFKALVGLSPSQYARDVLALRASVERQPLQHVPGCFSRKMVPER